MTKELLRKYCSNSCSEEELDTVLLWFKESAGTAAGRSLLSMIWDEVEEEDGNDLADYENLLSKIHHEINLSDSKRMLQIANQDLIRYNKREKVIRFLTRAAAILLFPVLGFGMFMSLKYNSVKQAPSISNISYNEVFSSVDAITKVTLPDGSNVWLNHSSSLRYPAIFQGDSRDVELKGEGYFEVATNPSKPFIVTAGTIDIMAIGTTFNVMAYSEEDKIETSLIEGCVELNRAGSCSRKTPLVKMQPTDMAIYQKSNDEFTIRTIADDRYFSWKEGKLVFNKEPIGEVASKLSRWFNVDIQVNDPRLKEFTYTGTFVDETLPQVMELMAMISPLSYKISDRKEISHGTFSKRKVIIAYKQN